MVNSQTVWRAFAVSLLVVGISVTIFSLAQQRGLVSPCGSQPCSDGSPGGGGVAALKDYFAEQGFFWAAVQPQKLSGGRWRYTVTPGEIYRFDRAVVVGANDNWSERFIKDLPLHAGEIFRPSLVRPWLDPLTQPGGGDSQVPYRMRKLTINTDRQKHLVSLVVEVTGRETVKVGEEPSAPGRR